MRERGREREREVAGRRVLNFMHELYAGVAHKCCQILHIRYQLKLELYGNSSFN